VVVLDGRGRRCDTLRLAGRNNFLTRDAAEHGVVIARCSCNFVGRGLTIFGYHDSPRRHDEEEQKHYSSSLRPHSCNKRIT
jgi:hypothetical protein